MVGNITIKIICYTVLFIYLFFLLNPKANTTIKINMVFAQKNNITSAHNTEYYLSLNILKYRLFMLYTVQIYEYR